MVGAAVIGAVVDTDFTAACAVDFTAADAASVVARWALVLECLAARRLTVPRSATFGTRTLASGFGPAAALGNPGPDGGVRECSALT
jgi:hypothetical protein